MADFKVFNRVVIPGDKLHQTNASYCLTSQDDFPPLNSVSVNFTRKQTLIGGGKTFSVGAEFDNYPEFKACFTEWCEDRFHPISIQRSSLRAPAARTDSHPYSQLTITCKHSGTARSRGLDMRPNQNYLSCNCPVQVNVRLLRSSIGAMSKKKILITKS